MSEPFLGEIRMLVYTFAPRGWADCDGQLLAISQNSALFSLIGTQYGGDGRTTFALPDLRGRVPMHPGQGPGLSSRTMGEQGGAETNQLSVAQLPAHSHVVRGTEEPRTTNRPAGAVPAKGGAYSSAPSTTVDAGPTSSTGSGQPIGNVQPFQVVRFAIALQGIYPSRS